ncbi:hypothetical protein [Marinobacter bohaiensis]|uniref:hypothetical protein n=1 Tax=Marinobacter bohaiensis TaxID=2201898 RepID=UPI000DACE31B|nr:hypothetical protein [Marinobacter bohaiensis]
MKRWLFAACVLATGTVAAVVTSPLVERLDSDRSAASPESRVSTPAVGDAAPAEPSLPGESDRQRFVRELAQQLRETYGDNIANAGVQASLLEVKRRLLKRYPDEGAALFEAAVKRAFADRAPMVLRTVSRMERYRDWLLDHQVALADMAPLEKNGALWSQRRALFGADADVIWAHEKAAWAQKREALKEDIRRLDQDRTVSLNEALYQLQTSLDEAYGSELEALAMDRGTVANVYFGLDSVQDRLAGLDADARQARINDIRRQLGYSQEQLAQLEAEDQYREARWQNGYAYMAERDRLTQSLDGDALQQALVQLRQDYFAAEARTIRLEEQNGFFRYERPRLYGRN